MEEMLITKNDDDVFFNGYQIWLDRMLATFKFPTVPETMAFFRVRGNAEAVRVREKGDHVHW